MNTVPLNDVAESLSYESWDEMYLDWFNNFLSIEGFASHHSLSLDIAQSIIEQSRKAYKAIYG